MAGADGYGGVTLSDTPVSGSVSPREPGSLYNGFTADVAAGGWRLGLELCRCGQVVVITVAGEIDLLVADQLREALIEQINTCPEIMVVDLEGVRFFGSTGLTALALVQRAAHKRRVDLRVVATSQTTMRPLQITGMTSELAVYASRRDALADHSTGEPDLLPAPRTC
jgi:anti-sigma B factor antagonist